MSDLLTELSGPHPASLVDCSEQRQRAAAEIARLRADNVHLEKVIARDKQLTDEIALNTKYVAEAERLRARPTEQEVAELIASMRNRGDWNIDIARAVLALFPKSLPSGSDPGAQP